MTVFRIRTAAAADTPSVKACIVALQEAERVFSEDLEPPERMVDAYWREVRRAVRKEDGTVLVAERDGEVVGFCTVCARIVNDEVHERAYEYARISDVAVLPGHRGIGVGAALIEAAQGFAREHGATRIKIGVLAPNRGAARLYKRLGFAPQYVELEKKL